MKKLLITLMTGFMLALTPITIVSAATPCQPSGGFFALPTWYKFLDGHLVVTDANNMPVPDPANPPEGAQGPFINRCVPKINDIGDTWLIVAAVVDILLRVAAFAAIIFIIIAGVRYITSKGEPDKTARALQSIIQATIGLTIAIAATAMVTFVARTLLNP